LLKKKPFTEKNRLPPFMILCLETATRVCSVALCSRSGVIASMDNDEGRSHASLLTVFIDKILKEQNLKTADLDAIAVSKGPGSYTGLRIGVSVAKGIAYASSIPLIGVNTTLSMFHGFLNSSNSEYSFTDEDLFIPAIDARRMEIFYSVFNKNSISVKEVCAEIMNEDSLKELPERARIFIFGDGAAKCREVIKRKNITYSPDFKISASGMHVPAYESFNRLQFEDVAYFEPFYLKDFLTSKPVKNILGK
jgi:tRNA threonylcarbamoyladenosine biosynthesis protein TsaB